MVDRNTVAKRFAEGWEKSGTRTMFIEGDTIFSYGHHFPIATRYKGNYIFNTGGYSSTTNMHKSFVRRNLPSKRIVYIKDADVTLAKEQIKLNQNTMKVFAGKLKRARLKKDYWRGEIKDLAWQQFMLGKL